MYFENLTSIIGKTPLLRLSRLNPGSQATILGKLECCNPGGSAKDRIAKAMLDWAEAEGLLTPSSTVIEPTSGNTGIAFAMLCAARGYGCIIVMPDSMSPERRFLMEAYGARVVLTPGIEGMAGAVAKAKALAGEIPGSYIPNQFQNPANPEAHYAATGPEIWKDTCGHVDFLVAGIGTGGTITGAGHFLKERNPHLRIIGVEPEESPLLSQGRAAHHGIQGIGPNFLPPVLDADLLDEIIPVTEDQAIAATRLLARREGLLAGISSGAAVHAAVTLAGRANTNDRTIVVILPDTGRNYLSGSLFCP